MVGGGDGETLEADHMASVGDPLGTSAKGSKGSGSSGNSGAMCSGGSSGLGPLTLGSSSLGGTGFRQSSPGFTEDAGDTISSLSFGGWSSSWGLTALTLGAGIGKAWALGTPNWEQEWV